MSGGGHAHPSSLLGCKAIPSQSKPSNQAAAALGEDAAPSVEVAK